MAVRSPHPGNRAWRRSGCRSSRPVLAVRLDRVHRTLLLVARMDGRVFLFPPEVLSEATDALRTDPAGLAAAGAGVELTDFTDPDRAATSLALGLSRYGA